MKIRINKKLNLSESRSGDRETGILTNMIIKFLALAIQNEKIRIQANQKLHDLTDNTDKKMDPKDFFPIDFQDSFRNALMNGAYLGQLKSVFKFPQKLRKSSPYLKNVKSIRVEFNTSFDKVNKNKKNYKKFELEGGNASYGTTDSGIGILTLKFTVHPGWDSKNPNNNYSTLNDIKDELQDSIRHELEHSVQRIKSKKSYSKSLNIYKKLKDPSISPKEREKLVKDASVSIGTKVQNFFSKLIGRKGSIDYEKDYVDVLKDSTNEFEKIMKSYGDFDGARKLVLYYLQPLETEAYAVGFMRQATLKADRELRDMRKKGSSGAGLRKKLIKKHFDKVAKEYKEGLLKYNEDLYEHFVKNLQAAVEASESYAAADRVIDDIISKMYDYVEDRYGVK